MKDKKDKNFLIYKLEIAINEEEGSIEYILETLDKEHPDIENVSVSLSEAKYYFDKEGLALVKNCCDIAES